MFACIYSRTVPKSQQKVGNHDAEAPSPLVDLAFTFSPLVEQTSPDTVVLDVSGQDLLFGPVAEDGSSAEVECGRNIATDIIRQSKTLGLTVNVAIAANVDVAIHAARFIKGVTIIPPGDELLKTRDFSIKHIDYSLVAIDENRAAEIQETFALWGIRTFGDLARLPLAGVAERLLAGGADLELALGDLLEGHRQEVLRAGLDQRRREALEAALAELVVVVVDLAGALGGRDHERVLAVDVLEQDVNFGIDHLVSSSRAARISSVSWDAARSTSSFTIT